MLSNAGRVGIERIETRLAVLLAADRVICSALKPWPCCCAGRVVKERAKPDGRVVAPDCIVKERRRAGGGVVVAAHV